MNFLRGLNIVEEPQISFFKCQKQD